MESRLPLHGGTLYGTFEESCDSRLTGFRPSKSFGAGFLENPAPKALWEVGFNPGLDRGADDLSVVRTAICSGKS